MTAVGVKGLRFEEWDTKLVEESEMNCAHCTC